MFFYWEGGGEGAYSRVGAYKIFGLSGWAVIQGHGRPGAHSEVDA